MTAGSRRVLVAFGGLAVARYRTLSSAAASRGLGLLVIDAPTEKNRRIAAAHLGPDRALSLIAEHVWCAGDDVAGMAGHCARWAGEYEIVGVICLREAFVIGCAVVADLLGMPGIGLRAAIVCRDKGLQRTLLADHSPTSVLWQPGEAVPDVTPPVVIKPLDSHSSLGVLRIEDGVELRTRLAAAGTALLVEDCVEGPEFSVEAVVHDGLPVFAGVTAKSTTEQASRYFVETAHTVPAPIPAPDTDALLAATWDCIARLGLRTGIVHAEWRLAADGRPRLMEVAARCPGDSLLALYELAYGRSLEAMLIDALLGHGPPPQANRRTARQVYPPQPEGTIVDIRSADERFSPGWLAERDFLWPELPAADKRAAARVAGCFVTDLGRGDRLGPVRSSADRAVTALFDGPTAAAISDLETAFLDCLDFEVLPGDERVSG